jgi:hypothetical protein
MKLSELYENEQPFSELNKLPETKTIMNVKSSYSTSYNDESKKDFFFNIKFYNSVSQFFQIHIRQENSKITIDFTYPKMKKDFKKFEEVKFEKPEIKDILKDKSKIVKFCKDVYNTYSKI